MKKLIFILLALIPLNIYGIDVFERTFKCEIVKKYTTAYHDRIERCENKEVVCYVSFEGYRNVIASIQCKFKPEPTKTPTTPAEWRKMQDYMKKELD